jgi:hypothetical protein
MLSEENQRVLSLGPCCTTPGGSVKSTDLPGETARPPAFCFLCETINVLDGAKVILCNGQDGSTIRS